MKEIKAMGLNLKQIKVSDEFAERFEKEQRQNKINQKIVRCIPEGYTNKIFDSFICSNDIQVKILKQFKKFSEEIKQGNFISVCCLGSYGIGKTHLACAVMIDVIQNGIKEIYGFQCGMSASYTTSDKIRERWERAKRFDSNESQSDVIESFCNSDLLVIDEIGRSNNSEIEKEILYQITDMRDRKKKSSFYLSNLKFEEFAKLLGGATMDRLKNSAVFPSFDGLQSHRGK